MYRFVVVVVANGCVIRHQKKKINVTEKRKMGKVIEILMKIGRESSVGLLVDKVNGWK